MSDRNCSCTCHYGGMRDPSCDRACFACGEAPSPLAREAVAEFWETVKDANPDKTEAWLLATLSRVEAATEARVRAEVWGKAYETVTPVNLVKMMICTGTYDENGDEYVESKKPHDAIKDAALADGVDLTSLPKTE